MSRGRVKEDTIMQEFKRVEDTMISPDRESRCEKEGMEASTGKTDSNRKLKTTSVERTLERMLTSLDLQGQHNLSLRDHIKDKTILLFQRNHLMSLKTLHLLLLSPRDRKKDQESNYSLGLNLWMKLLLQQLFPRISLEKPNQSIH
jgi:hypothetical protein